MAAHRAQAPATLAFRNGTRAPDEAFALTVFQFGLGLSVLARFLIPGNILNLVVDYTSDGGPLPVKIHPGTYGMALMLLLAVAKLRPRLSPLDWRLARQLVVLSGVVVALAVMTALLGHGVSAGYLLDTYISAALAGLLMLALPLERRRPIGHALLAFMVVEALVTLVERALGTRFLPYPYLESSFRPTAISDHPLELGLFLAASIAFYAGLRIRVVWRAACIGLLLVATFASEARTAGLVTAAVVALCVIGAEIPLATPLRRLQARVALVAGLLAAAPLAALAFSALGLLGRFQSVGLMDDSADARVRIYDLFGMVGWSDILLGADPLMIGRLARDRLNLPFIESPVITFTFQFGAIGAVVLFGTLAWTFRRLCAGTGWRGWLAAGAFLVCASSNNALATKNPLLVLIAVLLIAYRRPEAEGPV
jgi:hypothetical protein